MLLIGAVILTGITVAISVVFRPLYYLVTLQWKKGFIALDKWFYKTALSIDQFGQASNASLLNALLVKYKQEVKHLFGDEDDTASYIIAKNWNYKSLTKFGRFWGIFLNTVDKGHLKKAIANKIIKDTYAVNRIEKDDYFKIKKTTR